MLYAKPPKKMLGMNILDILRKYTDENHRLSQKQIGDILEKEYMMTADRKAIKRNLTNLLEFGYDIEYTEHKRVIGGKEQIIYSDWYLNNDFSDGELRLLIDSVLSTKLIPKNYATDIVEKLSDLGSVYFSRRLGYVKNFENLHYTINKEIFSSIEIIEKAIENSESIAFLYNTYGADKKLHTINDKKIMVIPCQMIVVNSQYYLVAIRDNTPCHYRIDKITSLERIKGANAMHSKINVNISNYITTHAYMLTGNVIKSVIKINNDIIDDLIDAFGMNFDIKTIQGKTFVTVETAENDIFTWALQQGTRAEVISPQHLRNRIQQASTELFQMYCKSDKDNLKFNILSTYRSCKEAIELTGKMDDIAELYKLTHLKHLTLKNNDIKDIEFLKDFYNLESLSVYSNDIRDFSVLSTLPNFTQLIVHNAKNADLSTIAKISYLKSLSLMNCDIYNVNELSALQNLICLDLSDNNVSNLDFLTSTNQLTSLNIENNYVVDISVLNYLKKLDFINIADNPITDISVLSSLKALTFIEANGCHIKDFSPLLKLRNLQFLSVLGNPYEAKQIEQIQKKFPNCGIFNKKNGGEK